MKIHQIAPPYIPVDPPIAYGGIERVMYQLDRALVHLGHETSMSAPVGSKPVGQLHETVDPIGYADTTSGSDLDVFFAKLYHMYTSITTASACGSDVVHIHDENMLPFAGFINRPTVSTIHSPPEEFWNPISHPKITGARNLVAVSRRTRDIYNEMGFSVRYAVHNGFDIDAEYFMPDKLDYIFTLGLIRPQKGQHVAIDVAERLEKSVIIAGNVGDHLYFGRLRHRITHSIEDAHDKLDAYKKLPPGRKVVYAGFVNDRQKFPLFGNAGVFLAPSLIEDSLPGVVIEAMACGTPVVGFNKGGIPEMIAHGRTGYVVDTFDGMTGAAEASAKISPVACREHYVDHFTSAAMADRYLQVYKEVLKDG